MPFLFIISRKTLIGLFFVWLLPCFGSMKANILSVYPLWEHNRNVSRGTDREPLEIVVVQPSCEWQTGSIIIATIALEYSIDGGLSYSPDNIFPNLLPGIYSVIVRKMDGSVSGLFLVTISKAPEIPELELIDIPLYDCHSVELRDALNTATPGLEYVFYDTDGTTVLENTVVSLSGIYFIEGFSVQGCSTGKLTAEVIIGATPQVIWSVSNPFICIDNNDNTVRTVLLDSGLPEEAHAFKWFYNGTVIPAAAGRTVAADRPGMYRVEVLNFESGCRAVNDTIVLETAYEPVIARIRTRITGVNLFAVQIVMLRESVYQYQLGNSGYQESNLFENVSGGGYIVRVKDNSGCRTAVKRLLLLDYPLYFTPNGDGYNDVWNIPSLSGKKEVIIQIFDQKGTFITHIAPDGKGWDGTHNGKALPENDYWFVMQYNDNNIIEEVSGHFSLKR